MAITFNSVDPRTGEPGPTYEEASPQDVRAAVEAAVPPDAAAGDRYAAAQMAILDSERA